MVDLAAVAPDRLVIGAHASIGVSVAGVWRAPDAPRDIDRPALDDRPDIRGWLAAMGDDHKRGLVGRLDTQALFGEPVEVLDIHRGWVLVQLPLQESPVRDAPYPGVRAGYEGFMPVSQLARAPLTGWGEVERWATVTAPTARLEAGGGTTLEVSFGTSLPALAVGVERIEVGLPAGGRGHLSSDDVALHEPNAPALSPSGTSVVESMRRFLGLPYLWAGTSGFGFDCSGLVHLVHRVHGIELPRDTGPMSEEGTPVQPADRRPGDLVFFERGGDVHHVVTWLGDGRVIESPRTGLAVREIALADLPYAHEVTVTRRVLPGA